MTELENRYRVIEGDRDGREGPKLKRGYWSEDFRGQGILDSCGPKEWDKEIV